MMSDYNNWLVKGRLEWIKRHYPYDDVFVVPGSISLFGVSKFLDHSQETNIFDFDNSKLVFNKWFKTCESRWTFLDFDNHFFKTRIERNVYKNGIYLFYTYTGRLLVENAL